VFLHSETKHVLQVYISVRLIQTSELNPDFIQE